MKILFVLSLLWCHAGSLFSQCPTDLYLDSQVEVDSFAIKYPGCDSIKNDLTVAGTGISNLEGLSVLRSVGGWLVICGRS
jgi:hypothetical protein